jgi:hypothetical protein
MTRRVGHTHVSDDSMSPHLTSPHSLADLLLSSPLLIQRIKPRYHIFGHIHEGTWLTRRTDEPPSQTMCNRDGSHVNCDASSCVCPLFSSAFVDRRFCVHVQVMVKRVTARPTTSMRATATCDTIRRSSIHRSCSTCRSRRKLHAAIWTCAPVDVAHAYKCIFNFQMD